MATPLTFISSLDWTVPIIWLGQAGYHTLDSDRHARLSLRWIPPTGGVSIGGKYNGMTATVLSATHGPIDRNAFLFDDYLDAAERIDNRADWQPGRGYTFMLVGHCGWTWYIAVPASTRPFTTAVEAWLDLHR